MHDERFWLMLTYAVNTLNWSAQRYERIKYIYEEYQQHKGVHQTLPFHIFSVQVKFEACYITGQWGRVQNKAKET